LFQSKTPWIEFDSSTHNSIVFFFIETTLFKIKKKEEEEEEALELTLMSQMSQLNLIGLTFKTIQNKI